MTGMRYCSVPDQDAKIAKMKNRKYKKYGITKFDLDKMRRKQGNKCAICGAEESALKVPLYIDHDHKTGKVRGLLCNKCNSGLYYIEKKHWVEKAREYLENTG